MRFVFILLLLLASCAPEGEPSSSISNPSEVNPEASRPYLVVLGIAQDGGAPQAGSHTDLRWNEPENSHMPTSLGLVDPETGKRWMFEATPDFRRQWYELDTHAGLRTERVPDGIFLTHAHIGHYTGLMFLGHESVGAQGVPVYVWPKMAKFLTQNGPWSQLVKLANIQLETLGPDSLVELSDALNVRSFLVPHRQEFAEVAGFVIEGPNRRVGFIPDIDSWEEWDSTGIGLERFLDSVDLALVDATFFSNGEIPGRDMSSFPHPFISHTMSRLAAASDLTKSKVIFIHINHTNPALLIESEAYQSILNAGFSVAYPGQQIDL